MSSPPPPVTTGYYGHAVALLILFWLWRFPTASAKSRGNDLVARVSSSNDYSRPGTTARKSALEAKSDRDERALKDALKHDEAVQRLFPNATAAERKRFLVSASGNLKTASAQLGAYLEWREKHDAIEKDLGITEIESDEDEWRRAAAIAMISCQEECRDSRLPRVARIYEVDGAPVRDRDGCRILHVMPGQMDLNQAKASTYALALALYIDRKLNRSSTECLNVSLDCRGGRGWPNIPPLKQLPFIKTLLKLLLSMFPQRLHRCLLFPVPPPALWIFNLIKVGIDPYTAKRVQLLTGPARVVSEPPYKQMEEFLNPEVAKLLESERHAAFKHETATEMG